MNCDLVRNVSRSILGNRSTEQSQQHQAFRVPLAPIQKFGSENPMKLENFLATGLALSGRAIPQHRLNGKIYPIKPLHSAPSLTPAHENPSLEIPQTVDSVADTNQDTRRS